MALSEQEQVRRESLQQLIELGYNPYPADLYPVTHQSSQIKEAFSEDKAEEFKDLCLAGRLMLKRIMGKAAFVELQDASGRIQLYIRRDDICPDEDKTLYNTVFKKLLDIGDHIGVKGYAFVTKTGETSIHVEELALLSKSLRPLPVVREKDGETYDAFSNPELRYRQRYVDLVVNPEVHEIFIKRATIIQTMRQFMVEKGYLEVETPILVGGYPGVFEFAKDFRNEGMDRSHNPEFTAMEVYVAYKDYNWMMDFTEAMIIAAVQAVHGKLAISYDGKDVDFTGPWKRISMYDAIKEYTGVDISDMDLDALVKTAEDLNVPIDKTMGKGKIIDEIFGEKVEDNLINPTFITDYPVEMSPLAKKHRDKEGLVERFEVICMGMEIANAFSELNDPIDQRQRFEEQVGLRAGGDEEAMVMDEDYLRAMEYGMPPTAGLGIGVDRIVMLLTDSHSIQEVLFFPQMRPEGCFLLLLN